MTSNETAEAINIAKMITSTISSFRNLVRRAWLSWSRHYTSTSMLFGSRSTPPTSYFHSYRVRFGRPDINEARDLPNTSRSK
jgi:hypothetical protein